MATTVKHHIKFRDMTELVKYLRETPTDVPDGYCNSMYTGPRAEEFTQTKSLDEALDIMVKGWPVGMEGIRKLTVQYRPLFEKLFPRQDFASEIHHDFAGETPDVGRYIEGEPENMMTIRPSNVIGPGLKMQRIIMEGTCSGMVQAPTIFTNGAMVMALADAMEGYGFQTELVIRFTSANKSWEMTPTAIRCYEMVVKHFDESPDFDKYAFIFAHPSMQRRIEFRLNELDPKGFRDAFAGGFGGIYGYPADKKEASWNANDLYIGSLLNRNLANPMNVYEKILKPLLVKHFGEEFFAE